MQWEFAGRLGPQPGRYVARRYAGDRVRQILVVTQLGGGPPPRRRLRRRGAREVAPGPPPAEAVVTRVTVIDADAFGERNAAAQWLSRAADDPDRAVARAQELLDRAVAGHRVAAADPYVADAPVARALALRIGYGTGEQVADGDWDAAVELPAPAPGRDDLRPQQRVALLLSGRDAALACEELALRARADLDRGRERVAALQLEAALQAALAELEGWRGQRDLAARLEELRGHRESVAAAAAAARNGTLGQDEVEAVAAALRRLEAALRARAVAAQEDAE